MALNGTSQESSTYKSKENYSTWWYVNKALTTRGVARGGTSCSIAPGGRVGSKMKTLNKKNHFLCSTIFKIMRKIGSSINNSYFRKVNNSC
jgi:hypothetical protein